jgi:regulator of protease activity HflC (stomatin/prohibitin superfamily)
MIMLVLLAVCAFILLLVIAKSVYLVKQAETIVIEKFGKYQRTLGPGLHIVVPFVESPHSVTWTYVTSDGAGKHYYRYTRTVNRIDLREAVYDFPKQNVITKDNVTMEINALLYYQITDPKSAVYEVVNLPEAIEKLTQTTLRNVIGSLDLDESLVSRDAINEKLTIILDEATDKWGVKVNRVELQEVNPPHDIRIAMEKQMRAERDRRAIILEAEGKKRSAILDAEGERESDILRAQGKAQAQVERARGEADSRLKITLAESEAIAMMQKTAPIGEALSYMLTTQYIKALSKMTQGQNDKLVVVPYEATALAGGLASMKKIFEEVK